MPLLVPQSYVPEIGRAKTDLHLHKPRRGRLLRRRWRCTWCRERCGRAGCTTRLAAFAAFARHADAAERTWSLAVGYLFTRAEALLLRPRPKRTARLASPRRAGVRQR